MKKKRKSGLPPGSIIYTGDQNAEEVFIHHLRFDGERLYENFSSNHKEVLIESSDNNEIDWYDVRGIHDSSLIEMFGKTFEIHSLALESISDIYQRPKFEEFDQGIFIVFKALSFDENNVIKKEHVSLYFRKGLLISFQETATDLFTSIRKRVHNNRGRIRKRGTDYLAYALMDVVADNYFLVLDQIENIIEQTEFNVLENPNQNSKAQIHHLKKELLEMRKSISPFRELISKFAKTDNPIIEDSTLVFIRDLYDHSIQILDMVETYRDILNGLQDLYLSELSFKMNQVMQVLTIISVIFIPLSFLAGIYGMNFSNIPELQYKYGYHFLWGVILLVSIGQLLYFRKKGWL